MRKAISSLKCNKAADRDGIMGEHLKYVEDVIAPIIHEIFEAIYIRKYPPNSFKLGTITPVLKKNKKLVNPDNYRRITVTQMISKIMELIMKPDLTESIENRQNPMQKGFTAGTSSIIAALFITEAIAEAVDTKKTLYIAMLDASKAFDVVLHSSLLSKLYNMDFIGVNWLMLRNWYQGMGSQVKWDGKLSRALQEEIGLRQGGTLSAKNYVGLTNGNLDKLSDNRLGFTIGTEFVGCPTCADDTALAADNPHDLQTALNICQNFARREHFDFSVTKNKNSHIQQTKCRHRKPNP